MRFFSFVLALLLICCYSTSIECESPLVPITISRIYGTSVDKETIEIRKGDGSTGELLFSETGVGHAGSTTTKELCVENTVHTLVLLQGDGVYWDKDSFVDIKYGNNLYIGRFTHTKYYRNEYKFHPYPHVGFASTWKYTNYQINDWASSTYADGGWQSSSQGNYPALPEGTHTRYYRNTVIFGDLTGYASFEVGVYTRYGVAIFVNGEEIYRHNLPTGTLSAATVPSTSDYNIAYRRAFASRYLLSASTVIAIEVHYPADYSGDDDFDAFVALVHSNSHRTWDGSVDGTHLSDYTGEYGENLWKNKISIKWYISKASDQPYNDFTFNNGRADFINMYRITSGYYDTGRRPKSWKLMASNDGVNWDLLDYRTNIVFSDYGHSMYFQLPQVRVGYKKYRWQLLSSNGSSDSELAGVSLMAYDMPPVEMAIAYSSRVFYSGESVSLEPLAKGFSTYTITPSLPNSLSIDTNTGIISGTASTVGISTHTVTAYLNNVAYTGTVTITIDVCNGDYRKVRVVFANPNSHNTPYYIIMKDGVAVHNVHFKDIFGSLSSTGSSSSQTDYFCLPQGTYDVLLGNDHNNAWSLGSTLTVSVYDNAGTALFAGVYSRMKNGDSFKISTEFFWENEYTGWKYLNDNTVPDNWATSSFDDSQWTETTSSIASVSTDKKIILYRRKITFESLTAESYEIDMKCRAGVILYLNGVEVYRYNVEGDLSASTVSTVSTTARSSFVFVGLVGANYLHVGENTFAVAVINPTGTFFLDFAATLRLRSSTSLLAHATGISTASSSGTVGNLFNGNINNYWEGTLGEEGAFFQFIWVANQHRMQQVNKYCYTSTTANPGFDPMTYEVLYTTNGETWLPLATHTNVLFTERSQEICFYISNPIAVRGMKTVVSNPYNREGTAVRLAIFDFYEQNMDLLTIPNLSYPSVNLETIATAPITPFAPTSTFYHSFTVNPPLPEGLVLGGNGVIYGSVATTLATTTYTVSATSSKGVASSAVLFLTVGDCGEGTLAYIRIEDTGSHGPNMGYQLIDLVTNDVLASYTGFPSGSSINHAYCFNAYNYRLILTDYTRSAWPSPVEIVSGATVLYSYPVTASSTPATHDFFPAVFYDDATTQWRYLMDGTAAPNGWNTASFTGTWATSSAMNMPNPATSVVTSYYCVNFNIYATSGYAIFETTVLTRGGYLVYVNGEEVGRVRMPTGPVTASTTPSVTSPTAVEVMLGVIFATTGLKNQDNLVCIEIHQNAAELAEGERAFEVSFNFNTSSDDGLIGGTFTYSHSGYYDSTWDERNFMAVDKNVNTKFTVTESGVVSGDHMWVQFSFDNGGASVFNYLKFYTGNSSYRRPLNIDVLASNGNNQWVTLNHAVPNWTTSGYGTYKEFEFTNNTPYTHYKVDVYGCGSGYDGLEIGEVYLGIHSSIDFCEGTDGYSSAFVTSQAYKPCGTGFSGYYYRTCKEDLTLDEEVTNNCRLNPPKNLFYNTNNNVLSIIFEKPVTITPILTGIADTWVIDPALPANLSFNTTSGVISGTLTTTLVGEVFTVTASNAQGNTQAILSITSVVVNCDATEVYPATNHKEYAYFYCPMYYFGYARVLCIGGEFEEPDYNNCFPRNHTIFSYGVSSISFLTGVAISPLTLLSDFPSTRVFSDPALPAGLNLALDGTISGTPTVPAPQTVYSITAVNRDVSLVAELTITVIDNGCAALDDFPAVPNGILSNITTGCMPGYSGVVSRLCTNGVFGAIDTSDCHQDVPSAFSYSPSTLTAVSGSAIVSAAPSVTGIVLGYSAIPALPTGLTIDSYGIISGKASTPGTTTHTIKASNNEGDATTVITITVTAVGCTGLDGVSVASGEKFTLACEAGMTGSGYRLCTNGVLGPEVFECTYPAPSNLAYESTSFTVVTNVFFNTIFPTFNSTVNTFSVEPALPGSILIDPTNGQIAGTSSEVSSGEYTVTASNDAGSTTTVISITVVLPTCSNLKELGTVVAGESVTYDCAQIDGYKGSFTRTCALSENKNSAKWSAPTDYCTEKKLDVFMLIGIVLIVVGVFFIVWGVLLMIKRENKKTLKTTTKASVPAPVPKAPAPAAPAAPAPAAPAPAPAPPAPAPAPTPAQ